MRARFVLLCQQAFVFAVLAAVVVPAFGVVTLDIVSPTRMPSAVGIGGSDAGSLVASQPVPAKVREVPLTRVDSASARALGRTMTARRLGEGKSSELGALTTPEPVGGFATVGVTWRHGVQVDEGAISIAVRTRKDGVWTGWESMDYHDDHGPDPGSDEAKHARPGTEAFVVGDVDDVQVKAESPNGSVPAGMRLALVDPSATAAPRIERPAIDTAHLTAFESGDPADPGDLTDPTDPVDPAEPGIPTDPAAEPGITPVAGAGVTPKPQIYSRAQWGADERMRGRSSLRYGEVHAAFVHHTVNANNYTRAQVPAILRGIYAYHTQSRGWSDIGYNFLVDRFGRIWEGRYGGVARPVVGAHTLGYNDYAMAMSAIGNFETARPSEAMLDAYGRLFAWKLSLHGVSAGSTRQWVGKRYFKAINGHRDAGQTACPGRYLYAKLPFIRQLTAKYQHTFASRDLNPQLSGTAYPDLVVRNRTTKLMSIVRTGGQTRYLAPRTVAAGWASMDLIASPGDLNGDRYVDMVGRNKATGVTGFYPGSPTGALGAAWRATTRFKNLDLLIGVGDFDGDGRNDLVGRDAVTKRLLLYPGRPGARFGLAVELAASWSRYNLTTGVGDFNRDGHVDLVARDGTGHLFLFPSTGRGLGTAKLLPGGWNGFDLIAGRGDVTNDGYPDLIARGASTRLLRIYTGTADGGLGTTYGPFPGFESLGWLAGTGQVTGSRARDIIGRTRAGALVAFANSGGRNIGKIVDTSVSLAGTNLVLNVGDWNHDGRGDVMTRTTAGQVQLRLGLGRDRFAAPVVAANGWQRAVQVISVGDVTGDGNNDLMSRATISGRFDIHPGNGSTGFTAGYEAHSAVASNRQAAVGLYDADGAPDTMITKTDGSLWFYPGNGPGGMTNGRRILTGLQYYDWLVGLGDLDGDGRSDLVGRLRANGSLYLLPGTSTGFGARRFIAAGFNSYDLAG